VSAALVLTLAFATTIATTILVADNILRSTGDDLQARATALARTIDQRLRTYTSALDTIAESHSLLEEFDLSIVEWEARRVGDLFGGWFVLARAGDVMDILMATANPEGDLPPPEPRTSFPEVVRAETESIRTGEPVVSDAFWGRTVKELIITTVRPVETQTVPAGLFMYFSVSLRDITSWMEETVLDEGEFAAMADGSRRVIARSQDNKDVLRAGLPEWYIAFSEGRESGIAIGPPAYGGETRLFAMQRLDVAPGWTLAISRPVPNRFAAIYLSPWPLLSGLGVLLLGSVIAGLFVGRRQAQDQAATHAAMLAELRAADARKSRLMAMLAHDLRAPLVAMLGSLDLFREGPAKPEQERILERLKTDGHGMLTLIDDVLELALLGAGEARLRPEPFAPLALLTQVGDLVRPAAERNGTEILVQIDDLPDLVGDVASLRRVLLNFATNAVKATRGGSIRLSATQTAAGVNGHIVTFAVTDTGRGISPDDMPRLFRDFGMLERDSPTTEGTGLGLAICRRLATAMGGEVGAESTPGQGSRFWLRLSLPEASKAVREVNRETDDPFGVLVGLKVLVAEDHDTIRQLTCAALARAGMIPTEAADGEIAVERAEAEAFDLILMDLQMPRLDGDAAAVRIRGGGGPSARARIICVTAHQSPQIALLLSDLAFDACVRKPLDLRQLAEVMQEASPSSAALMSLDDFDADSLALLREIDGGDLLARTLRAFAADIETTRTNLAELVLTRDTEGIGRPAHKLVGLADILGARTLSAELRNLDDLSRDPDFEALERGLARVDEVMTKTRLQVENLIAELDHLCSGEGGRV
jgi:signal transduction histidine kinase/DNA-binding response OmpR family regulator